MKLKDLRKIINFGETILIIHDDKEIYYGVNNVYYGGGKYCTMMNCYDDEEVREITRQSDREAILIYLD